MTVLPVRERSDTISELIGRLDAEAFGEELYSLAARLYPLCRSISGEGIRETLRILKDWAPMEIHEVASGTQVFDWTVPREWNVSEAWIKDPSGRKIVDFQEHNLHVLGYSIPVQGTFSLEDLKPHLFTLPAQPDLIPYKTSYYNENWGFCLSHRTLKSLRPGKYEVLIDSSLKPGHLTYGEAYLPGRREEEVLISTHCCHPSMANDNLSGIAVAAGLAQNLGKLERRYSYRFLFLPATIGAVTWLARNEKQTASISHGLVLSCLGDPGHVTYKKSRRGDATVDRAVSHILRISGAPYRILEFSPYGYDERQYCSPGFDLPVGCFMRTPYGEFPQYHTSADDLSFITSEALGDSYKKLLRVVEILETDRRFENMEPKGEPQLGKRGLYSADREENMAILWVLNLSDRKNTLLDIADRSKMAFERIASAARTLVDAKLLRSLD